jgi:hypothetical protein
MVALSLESAALAVPASNSIASQFRAAKARRIDRGKMIIAPPVFTSNFLSDPVYAI